ncbi:MAG: PIN domain-containing protein [Chloroflexi bacterium]|nr:PIN domain-containing protein [Chloroflexota bacterium]
MTVIADSNVLYALYNIRDASHLEAITFVSQNNETLLVPDVTLPEVCYLLTRDIGYFGLQGFLRHFTRLNAQLVPTELDDLRRVREIAIVYADAEFDIVDCCIMAIAERLNITRIATFDRRDFSMFRPSHCEYLELSP